MRDVGFKDDTQIGRKVLYILEGFADSAILQPVEHDSLLAHGLLREASQRPVAAHSGESRLKFFGVHAVDSDGAPEREQAVSVLADDEGMNHLPAHAGACGDLAPESQGI